MGKRGFSAFEMHATLLPTAFVSICVGGGGGVVVSIAAGGEAGGVICNELDGYIPFGNVLTLNVLDGSVNGKFAIELVGLSEQIGDARSEPVDMLNGGLIGNECTAAAVAGPTAFVFITDTLRPNVRFACGMGSSFMVLMKRVAFVIASTSFEIMLRPTKPCPPLCAAAATAIRFDSTASLFPTNGRPFDVSLRLPPLTARARVVSSSVHKSCKK